MLDTLTNSQLIEKVMSDQGATSQELALVERLQAAITELDNVTQSLQLAQARLEVAEVPDGADA